jgi:hypothetical protein
MYKKSIIEMEKTFGTALKTALKLIMEIKLRSTSAENTLPDGKEQLKELYGISEISEDP